MQYGVLSFVGSSPFVREIEDADAYYNSISEKELNRFRESGSKVVTNKYYTAIYGNGKTSYPVTYVFFEFDNITKINFSKFERKQTKILKDYKRSGQESLFD